MHKINVGLLYFLSLGVAGYALVVYSVLPLGKLVHPDMTTNFQTHSLGIYTHIFASIIALVIGPIQFSQAIRQRHIKLHRWLGRIYLSVGVLVGGISGLYMAQFAFGGFIARLGFATLALLWLYTGLRAYLAIRGGVISEHRAWMIRNFALTFAAVTLRLYLPASMAAGVDFSLAYSVIAWLCWVPNMLFVEWWYISQRKLGKSKV